MRGSCCVSLAMRPYFPRPYVYRPGMLGDEYANAVITSMPTISRHRTIDINEFHVAHAHVHEGAFRNTAKKIGVNLEGGMHEFKGRSKANHFRMSIPKKTDNREVKRISRCVCRFGGKTRVASVEPNKYPVIVRHGFSRYVWVF